MDTGSLFAVALNLPRPWCISQVEFKPTEDGSMELHIHIAFQRGGKVPCPQKTARACAMRIELQEIYEQSVHRDEAEQRLKKLCSWMMHARLEPMKKFCGTIRNHWDEILHYFEHPYTNAILEGANGIIQNIKRRARGFRNDEYFKTMIYLGCGKLNLNIQIP